MRLTRRTILSTAAAGAVVGSTGGRAQGVADADWPAVVEAARGQTVYFNAWGGKQEINAYFRWAAGEVAEQYGVDVRHVKLRDTADAVARILSEVAAGRRSDGSVDLLWANGENFAALMANDLLFGPWTQTLPNYRLVDLSIPSNTTDFGTPVRHMEAPFGLFKLNFPYAASRIEQPPRSVAALLEWARAHPGRFTYPHPANFIGHTFLKQLLYGLLEDTQLLQEPVPAAGFERVTGRLWDYLDALHPHLWRQAARFPVDENEQRQLLADRAVDISISFGPGETSAAIALGLLPPSVRTFVFEDGTIGNTSFLSIPSNASAKQGAMVFANFLLSPRAQARKQDPDVWGVRTVLDVDALPEDERALFEALPRGWATLSTDELGPTLLEPHFSWTVALQDAWVQRYGS